MRILRSYRRMAEVVHWCERCCTDILPGEFYEGEIMVGKTLGGREMFYVRKVHVDPPCDEPPVEEWEDEMDDEVVVEEEVVFEKAA
jgi:hypothetical protein